jgi:hypothetical protein
MEFKLGSRVRDVITGLTGIAISRIEYLTGCTQYGVTPGLDKDGKVSHAEYFDHTRLTLVDEGVRNHFFVDTDAADLVPIGSSPGGPNRDAPTH